MTGYSVVTVTMTVIMMMNSVDNSVLHPLHHRGRHESVTFRRDPGQTEDLVYKFALLTSLSLTGRRGY